jgi:peptidoglycan/xylan/chitin deacetylase (PgdA/CDA1 family)
MPNENLSKIQVALTFDLDGETLWLSRDKTNPVGPVMKSQGAYGPKVAVPRILSLLKKYDIKATFFVPGWITERYERLCDSILRDGHEIGHHGYLHEWPNRTAPDEEKDTFNRAIEILEKVTGYKPYGYRAPGWEFSNITLDLLLEHGMIYSSNMMDSEQPYEHIIDGRPSGLIELPVSWTLDDAAFFMFGITTSGYAIANSNSVMEIWKEEFDGMYDEGAGKIYVLTLHPQIMGRPSRMAGLERLINHMRGRFGVEFLRGVDAAKKFKAKN